MSKITPCLWFDGQAEEAANFYVSVFPDSRVDEVMRSPADTPSGPEGSVLLVEFTIGGQSFTALNGGPSSTSARPFRSWSTAPIRQRSIVSGRRCPRMPKRSNAAG